LLTEIYRKFTSWAAEVFNGEVAFQAAVDKVDIY
jgi:hypothetical protein